MTRTSVVFAAVAALAAFSAAEAGPSEALAFAIGQCSSQPDDKARLLCYDMIAAQLRAGQQVTAAQPFVQVPQTAPAQTARAPQAAPSAPQSAPSTAPVAQLPAYAPAPQQVAPAPQQQAQQTQSGGTWYDPTSWFGKDNPERTSDKPADFGAEALRNQQTAAAAPDQPKRLEEMQAGVTHVDYAPNGRFTVTLDNGQVWRQLDGDTGQARFNTKGGDTVTISRGLLGSYNLVVAGRAMLFKVRRVK